MENKIKKKNIEAVKKVLHKYLKDKGLRNTPERYTILEEIYNYDKHFNVDDLYLKMMERKYHISKATIYNMSSWMHSSSENTSSEKALLMRNLILINSTTI